MYYYLIYFFVVAYPFMIYPWGANPYYSTPKFYYLLLFTVLLWSYYLIRWFKHQEERAPQLKKGEWLALLFLGGIFLSTMLSVDLHHSIIGEWRRYEGMSAFFAYLSLFFFAHRLLRPEQMLSILKGFVYSSGLVALYAILQHYHWDFLPRTWEKLSWTRSYAFFDNPNFFGSYLTLVLPIACMFYFTATRKKEQFLYILIISVLFISLIYSLTRSAWLGFCLAILLYLGYILLIRREWLKKWLLLFLLFGILFVSLNWVDQNSYLSRLDSMRAEMDQWLLEEERGHAGSNRWYIWQTTYPLISTYFWTGSGPDTFALVFPDEPQQKKIYFGNPYIKVDKAHNEYLQMAITLGVPTLCLYLLLLGIILLKSWQTIRSNGKDQTTLVAISIALCAYLLQAVFNSSVISVAPYYWLLLGCGYHLATNLERIQGSGQANEQRSALY